MTHLRDTNRGSAMKILLSSERIRTRVGELASQIKDHYQGQPITIVGVLTGCLMFLADLVRHLDMPVRLALIQASSYRGSMTRPGELRVQADLVPDLRNRHVLLIDDILDTGQTLGHLVGHLQTLEPASIRIAVLLRKLGRQQLPIQPDFFGFDIPDVFVVGYGLDFNDEYRHLPHVAVLSNEVDRKTAAT
jgi:hypoxanthine phosphoribosyltransferase